MWPFTRKWVTPQPQLVMVVGCGAAESPSIMQVANPTGAGGAVRGMAGPAEGKPTEENMTKPMVYGQYVAMGSERAVCACTVERISGDGDRVDLPPEMLPAAGLTPQMLQKFNTAAWRFTVQLMDAGSNALQAVEFATQLAQRVAALSDGVVMDVMAYRYFGPEGWPVERPVGEFDCRRHITVHLENDGGLCWCHTHGLLKFGRAELEIYDVPEALSKVGGVMLLDIAQYTITGAVIKPGHTVGDPKRPMSARVGTKNRRGHWEDAAVLELVDVVDGKPVASGAARGIEAHAQ